MMLYILFLAVINTPSPNWRPVSVFNTLAECQQAGRNLDSGWSAYCIKAELVKP